MKKTLLLLFALLTGVSGAWATDVVISDRTNTVATTAVTTTNEHKYGTYSNAAGGTTFTTNATSGMAGVTVTADAAMIRGAYFSNSSYLYCMGFNPSDANAHTITISAPEGYKVTGYSITAISTSSGRMFTVTPAGDTPTTNNVTAPGTTTITKTGLDAQTATINIRAANANTGNFLCFPLFSVTVVSATIPTVNVTYELYESDGTTLVNSVVREQEENSALDVPSSLTAPTYYDYATEGTIGTTDCTIKVIRTLKSGYAISLGDLNSAKCYNIRNNRGTWAVGSGAEVVNSTDELNLAFLASDTKQQFAFIYYDETDDNTNNGNYYLYSVGESKFAYVNGTKLSLTENFTAEVAASPVTFGASTNSTYMNSEPIIVKVGGQMFGVSPGQTPDVFKYNYADDGGNCAYVIEAGSFDASAATALVEFYFTHTLTYVVKDANNNTLFTSDPVYTHKGTFKTLPSAYHRDYFFTYATDGVVINNESSANTNLIFTVTPKDGALQYTATASSPIYYNLNIRSKYLAYNDEATGDVELLTSSTPFNPNAAWAFIGDPYTGFKIINQANGTDKYLTYTSVVTGGNGGNNNIQFVADASFTNQYWYVDANTGGFCLRMKENTNIYFHHDNNNNFLRTCSVSEWSAVHNDAGSTLTFASDEQVLQDLYDALKNVFFGNGAGQFQWNGSGTAEQARANINSAGLALENHVTSSYSACYSALLDIKENISLNTTIPTGFYRIKGKTSNKYLAAGLAANSKFNMTTAEDATTIFYYDGTKLTNLSSGMCNGVNASDWAWVVGESASTVTFHDGHTIGGYGVQTATAYFYDNGDNTSSADRGTNVNMSSGDNRYRSWELTEITTLPVTISSAKWATLYSPVALTIPNGVTVYYISGLTPTVATLSTISTTIPAETPVILYADVNDATTYNFDITTDVTAVSGNKLSGQVAAFSVSADDVDNKAYYTLQRNAADNTIVGFYPKTAAGSIAGFKAYLLATTLANAGVSNSRGLSFAFDDVDAINALGIGEQGDNVIYDLSGRRVTTPTKGLYIVNGRKVVVK